MTVWSLEWRQAFRRRRVMVLSIGVPLLLVAVLIVLRAPAPHAALVFTVLFTFFGTFGAAVPWARDSERGWLQRLVLGGIPMPSLLGQRVTAGALIDLVQLVPAVLLIGLAFRAEIPELARLALATGSALLFANFLGVVIAAATRSLAETALVASMMALLFLHAGGVFRPAQPGTAADAIQRVVPFHYLHRAMTSVVE